MKNLLVISIIFIILLNAIPALSQGSVEILGSDDRWGPSLVIRFEVIDSITKMPIENALIALNSKSTTIFNILTNKLGIGVVIVLTDGNLPSSGELKIAARNHYPMETAYHTYELYEKIGGKGGARLYILGMEHDWSCTDRPNIEKTIDAVKNGKYKIIKNDDIYFQAPDCIEYTVELKKIKKEIDIYTR